MFLTNAVANLDLGLRDLANEANLGGGEGGEGGCGGL